ncbi:MAG: 2,3-bisphosphoglycerate-independent phosphoglycerate mutase [Planctomycetes bacterium]|nr:2,3-bisphosphoglycerate-independent phosphoglycerate mutase [Planctomycetota bacterium]
MIHEKTQSLVHPNDNKIVLLILDGLGGLPHPLTGKTEMETAKLPHLDRLARLSSGGRMQVIDPGVTPGSGPAHLALFGYHPYHVEFGRGALEALGSGFDMEPRIDLAARANFATLESPGHVSSLVKDRRAGRPGDAECRRLCEKLSQRLGKEVEGCQVFILPGKEHRFTVVFRGAGLAAGLNDNDPQREGNPLIPIEAAGASSKHAARVVNAFLKRGLEILADEKTANGMLLRGFSALPQVQPFNERYGLKSGAIAAYPMYRGVAKLVGMEVLGAPKNFEEELAILKDRWRDFNFFFVHFKGTDTAGHSGLFDEKVKALQEVDAAIPAIEALEPEVLIVTGDHSTPCIHKEHSWHPVPAIIRSPLALPNPAAAFSERGLMAGDLGIFPATHLIPLALAHASKLDKFGA